MENRILKTNFNLISFQVQRIPQEVIQIKRFTIFFCLKKPLTFFRIYKYRAKKSGDMLHEIQEIDPLGLVVYLTEQ